MPLRFQMSFPIFPGVRLNINKRSLSLSFRGRHSHYTVNNHGQRTESVDLPGPFSWRRTSRRD